jgi:hypothetical protein
VAREAHVIVRAHPKRSLERNARREDPLSPRLVSRSIGSQGEIPTFAYLHAR